jgi:Mce-associated membrane protein
MIATTVIVDEATVAADENDAQATDGRVSRFSWKHLLAYGVLPGLALILAMAAGYLKWQVGAEHQAQTARVQSLQAATEGVVALLSYRFDTAEKDLSTARERLTGDFRDSYTGLINGVVIPGAKEKQISAEATVPGAASVSATENRAVVLLFINQTITVGTDPPTATASSVRVTLDKVHDRWLISQFEPV